MTSCQDGSCGSCDYCLDRRGVGAGESRSIPGPGPCDESRPIPSFARCQEASRLSRMTYIACNQPAVAVVHHDRDKRGYYMCAGCTDHNLRNRGGKLVRIKSDWRGLAHGLSESTYLVDCDLPDPNEGNPFEPPETDAQRSRRVGAMIRKNVDDKLDAQLGRRSFLDKVAATLSDQELDYLVRKLTFARVRESMARVKALILEGERRA